MNASTPQKTKNRANALATPTTEITEITLGNETSGALAPSPPHPSPLYPTEQYRALGILHCAMCGEKARTGMHGEVICALASKNCPRLNNNA